MELDKLPILNLRNINPGDTKEFWDDIEARYPIYEGKDRAEHDRVFQPIEKLQKQIMLKLSTFPTSLSIIFDIDDPTKPASEISTQGYPAQISPEFKQIIDGKDNVREFALSTLINLYRNDQDLIIQTLDHFLGVIKKGNTLNTREQKASIDAIGSISRDIDISDDSKTKTKD